MSERVTGLGPGSEVVDAAKGALLPVAFEDLVAWYPFRSGTGEDLTAGDSRFGDTTDYSATVNGATFKPSGGTTDIQTGANSGAFDFDGVDDTLDLGTVADSDQSLTVMAWVKPDVVNVSKRQRVISKYDGSGTDSGAILLDIAGDAKPRFGVVNSGSFNSATGKAIPANQYVHLAGRYDFSSGQNELFVNGTSVDTASAGQVSSLSGQPFQVGADKPIGFADERLNGTVDGTRIYTAALSDSQINQIYLNTEP